MESTITAAAEFQVGELDRRIFGGFAEHLGRCVYEGMYDPGSLLSDEQGYRRDVLSALKRLEMPVMRYPGGNFVSCYDWRDGVGPKENRPKRVDYAWGSIESNQFGVDEFMPWCRKLGTEPIMAINLGTLGTTEAAQLLEYCNLPKGTYWADQRVKNGHADPYKIKYWCLGNEMDGPWQAGHVPAHHYALRANASSRMMKGLDSSIETIVCGSCTNTLPTYLDWDRTVLQDCWETIDYVSAHRYSSNEKNESPEFLAEGINIDRVLADYSAVIDYVRGVRKSKKKVYVCFDEWNVWYRQRDGSSEWVEAPHILEEIYNLEDALVVAQYLNAFIRRADLVKIACIAQIVNVIAPIMTSKNALVLQTIFHPFEMIVQHSGDRALKLVVTCPTYAAGKLGEAPTLDAAGTYCTRTGRVMLSVVNRSMTDAQDVTLRLLDRKPTSISFASQTTGDDLKAANTFDNPNAVTPSPVKAVIEGAAIRISLPKTSHAVVVVETAGR
ncbi:MAG: alpha-N-arabinofuranosidase [Burkholderiales bacterium]|nr:alpha-N-arabinofuranosidase [Phycisphaerae bacterium]